MRGRAITTMWAGAAAAATLASVPVAVSAQTIATVREPASPPRAPAAMRLKSAVALPGDPRLHVDDPRSPLRTGFGGSIVDLFPFGGGKFHLSAGPRLLGRPGRAPFVQPESLALLPSFRAVGASARARRAPAPAMLVGYGRTVDRGLAIGIDTGVVMGRIATIAPGMARLMRADAPGRSPQGGHGGRGGMNQVARATMLFRF